MVSTPGLLLPLLPGPQSPPSERPSPKPSAILVGLSPSTAVTSATLSERHVSS